MNGSTLNDLLGNLRLCEDAAATLPDALTKSANDLSRGVAEKRDGLISAEITARLGHPNWQLFAIAHRLRRVRYKDQPQETWLLDDKPLIEIWPLEIETAQEGNATKVVASFKHRTFRQ